MTCLCPHPCPAHYGHPHGHFLFFDTETTGLPAKGQYGNAEHPDAPHLVELAAILTDIDNRALETLHCLVRPEGFIIPPDASAIHGITHDRAVNNGIPLWQAMWKFDRLISSAVSLVAHNHQFDRLIVKAAHFRLHIPHRLRTLESRCTMRDAHKIMGGRWPKLQAAHQYFFNETFDNAHSALADVEACRRIFFHMRNMPAPLP